MAYTDKGNEHNTRKSRPKKKTNKKHNTCNFSGGNLGPFAKNKNQNILAIL